MILPLKAGGLSFVTPVAYDYRYAWRAIRSYYGIADEIILGLDRDRIAWSGRPFEIDEGDFRRWLAAADPLGKIRLVEGDFHAQATAHRNDTFARKALSLHCKKGNWIVQIDSDEILLNPEEFRDWLLARRWPWLVQGRWRVVFKLFGEDYLVVDKDGAFTSVATRRRGSYTGSRNTRGFKRRSPLNLLHFAWGRSEAELRQKLACWTHFADFDTSRMLELWKSVDLHNYRGFRDIHPLDGPDWPALRLVRKGDPDWVAPPR